MSNEISVSVVGTGPAVDAIAMLAHKALIAASIPVSWMTRPEQELTDAQLAKLTKKTSVKITKKVESDEVRRWIVRDNRTTRPVPKNNKEALAAIIEEFDKGNKFSTLLVYHGDKLSQDSFHFGGKRESLEEGAKQWLERNPADKPRPVVERDVPTKYLHRFREAMTLVCRGHCPPDELLTSWLDGTSEDLQEFAVEHAPIWAQGIVAIEAAMTMADNPTEGVGHEYREQPERKPAPEFDDPSVQTVYDILCSDESAPPGEHWEGFAARRIIDALSR